MKCSMSWVHPFRDPVSINYGTTVTIDQSRGNPSGQGGEPMFISLCVNKP